jgi:hypothetical protein
MPETREQISIKTKRLNIVVDEIFDVFESVHEMLRDWKCDYHMLFIEQVMRLQKLETELYALGYQEDFIFTLMQVVFQSVLGGQNDRRSGPGLVT